MPSHLFFITDNDFVHFVSTAFQITVLLCYNFICSPNSCSLYYHCSSLFSFHIFFEKLFFTVIILRSPNNCSSVLSSHLVTLSLSLNCSHIFFYLIFFLFLLFYAISAVLRIVSHLSRSLFFSLLLCSFHKQRHLSCSSHNLLLSWPPPLSSVCSLFLFISLSGFSFFGFFEILCISFRLLFLFFYSLSLSFF